MCIRDRISFAAFPQTGNKVTLTITAASSTDTASLSNRINLKVDSLSRKADSICYWVNGASACLIAPQVDTTSLSDRINLKLDSSTFAIAIADYVKLVNFSFVNLNDVDTTGQEDGDFVRYKSATNSYYLSGFPAVLQLDITDNGLVGANYGGKQPADSSFMLKTWTDSIYAAKTTTLALSGNSGIQITGGTQSLASNRTWTIAADTFSLSTKGNVRKVADSLGAIIATKGNGTVSSVGSGYGLLDGPITTSGTLRTDTFAISTKANVRKVADSLGALIGGGGSPFNLYTSRLAAWEYWTEFISIPTSTTNSGNDLAVNATGTGSGVGAVNTPSANRPGIIQLQTGTTTTGRTSIYANSSLNTVALGGGTATLVADILVPTLSTATERFAFLFGLYDATTMNQTDGVYFLYDEGGVRTGSTASANWQCVTASNSVRTFTTTSTAVSNSAYQRLSIEVNAAGTSVVFKIDGTTVATHTTNIPTGTARVMSYGYQVIKSAGTTGRTVNTDFLYIKINFTTGR